MVNNKNDIIYELNKEIESLTSDLVELSEEHVNQRSRADVAEQTNLKILFHKCITLPNYKVAIVEDNIHTVIYLLKESMEANKHSYHYHIFSSPIKSQNGMRIEFQNGSRINFISSSQIKETRGQVFNDIFISKTIDDIECKDVLDFIHLEVYKNKTERGNE